MVLLKKNQKTKTCKFIYFSKIIKLKKTVFKFITENLKACLGCILISYIKVPNLGNVPSLSKVLRVRNSVRAVRTINEYFSEDKISVFRINRAI